MTCMDAEELTTKRDKPRISRIKVIFLGIVVVLPCTLSGLTQTYSAVALPQMKLSVADTSLFASAPGLAAPIGVLLLAIVIDAYGRRAAMLVGVIPYVVGWSLICLDDDVAVTIVARLVTGITAGIVFYPGQVYACECLALNYTPRVHNYLATFSGLTNSLGMILAYSLSCFFDYLTVAGCAAFASIAIFALVFVSVPESPAWLRSRGRVGDAEASQRRLGMFRPLLDASSTVHESAAVPVAAAPTDTVRWSAVKSALLRTRRTDVRKALVITTILQILATCTGGPALLSYMVDVIGDDSNAAAAADAPGTSSYAYGLISAVLVLVARALISFTLPHVGGRKLMIGSCVIYSLGAFLIGDTLLARPGSRSPHVAAVWLATFAYSYGVACVPAYTLSDMFPKDAKGFAGIPILAFLLSSTATIGSYPYLSAYCGGYVYYGYATVSIVCAVFVFLFLPDVIGKTSEEISDQLTK